jgi:hypothetical protein
MAQPSTAGTPPLFSYISRIRSPPYPDLTPCLQHLQSTISLSPSSRSARRISSTLRQYVYTVRDGQRGSCDALIYFLRILRLLRNGLGVKTSDWWGRWLHQVNDAHAQSKSSNRLPSLCSTQPHKGPFDKPLSTSMKRATCVPGIL